MQGSKIFLWLYLNCISVLSLSADVWFPNQLTLVVYSETAKLESVRCLKDTRDQSQVSTAMQQLDL